MSTKVNVQFEIRNSAIMKDTLKQLGFNFEETNQDRFVLLRKYNNIVIDAQRNEISFDSDNNWEVNKIKQNYMINWYKDKATREGNDVQEEVKNNGEIVLNIRHA